MATATKTRGMIFTGDEVRALLDGGEVEKRFAVKTPTPRGENNRLTLDDWDLTLMSRSEIHCTLGDDWPVFDTAKCGRLSCGMQDHILCCPYGIPGDRLWVKEAFDIIDDPAAHDPEDGPYEVTEYEGEVYEPDVISKRGPDGEWFVVDYKVDEPGRILDKIGKRKWRSPTTMPRWAARLFPKITDVRVERNPWEWVICSRLLDGKA